MSKRKPLKHNNRVGVNLTKPEYDKLTRASESIGIGRAAIVRGAYNRGLKAELKALRKRYDSD